MRDYSEVIQRIGRRDTVAAAYETLWPPGGAYTFLSEPEQLRVAAGGSANDDVRGGPNAHVVLIDGLTVTGKRIQEIVPCFGAGASPPTEQSFFRVNFVGVGSVGTEGASNDGDIVIEGLQSSTVVSFLPAGIGRSAQAVYTSPSTVESVDFLQGELTSDGGGIDLRVRARALGLSLDTGPVFGAWQVVYELFGQTNVQRIAPAGAPILPYLDLMFEVRRASGTVTSAQGSFDLGLR